MSGPWHDPRWRAEFRRGAREILPAGPGISAWALVTGVAMVKSGLPVPMAALMSVLAYAGSAQLASLPLIGASAPAWVIAATAMATNMRFVIYAAALRPWLADYSRRRLLVLGYLSGDFSFVLFMNRVAREGRFAHRDAYFLGMTVVGWALWQVPSLAGILGAAAVPPQWGLEFAGTLALLALIVPALRSWPGVLGASAAGLVAVGGHHWPYRLGLPLGIVVGVALAMTADDMATRRSARGER